MAALAADKRTEREQFALVELMLYKMFKPKSKKTQGKDNEMKVLHKQIVQDKWKKAIHSVIAREGISTTVKKRALDLQEQALQVDTGPAPGGVTQGQHPVGWGWRYNGANTSAGSWQHWQQELGIGSMSNMMQPHMMQPIFRPAMNHTGALPQEANACEHLA